MREVPGSIPGSAQIFYAAILLHSDRELGRMIVLLLFIETVHETAQIERNNRK